MYIDLYGGHLIPGTLFFLLGIRWVLVTCYLHAKSSDSLAQLPTDSYNENDNDNDNDDDDDDENEDSSNDDNGTRDKHTSHDYSRRRRRRRNGRRQVVVNENRKPSSWSKQRAKPYRSTPTMPAPCLPCAQIRHEWTESYLKLLGSIVGIVFHAREGILEYQAATADPTGYVTHDTWPLIYRVKHHIIMYVAFFIGSIVELLIHCQLRLPARLDRALLLIEFGVEAFVFANHFHGRNRVDEHFHVLLAMTIMGCLLFTILETINNRQVLFTYGRILFTFLQATWFYQVAFTLYHPYFKWDTSDDRLTANVTFHYAVHIFVVVALMLVCHWTMFRLVGPKRSDKIATISNARGMAQNNFYGVEYEVVCCHDESDNNDNVMARHCDDAAAPKSTTILDEKFQ